MNSKLTLACAIALSLGGTAAFASSKVVNNNISKAEVKSAQQAWGEALIQISTDYRKGGIDKARATASEVLDAAYGYNLGPVLFKPTLASGEQTFRTSHEGALAYFVGGDSDFPSDSGFALKGWTGFEVDNAAVYINGDLALTMGHLILTDKKGQTTTVDKTWGFKRDEQGDLRIVLHHSSLPFAPTPG